MPALAPLVGNRIGANGNEDERRLDKHGYSLMRADGTGYSGLEVGGWREYMARPSSGVLLKSSNLQARLQFMWGHRTFLLTAQPMVHLLFCQISSRQGIRLLSPVVFLSDLHAI